MFGAVDSGDGDQPDGVTELVAPDEARASSPADESAVARPRGEPPVLEPCGRDTTPDPDELTSDRAEEVAERVRARGERVRRRELETALQRLEASGAVSREERRILDRLAGRITTALVERWTAGLDDDGVDPEAALELLADEGQAERQVERLRGAARSPEPVREEE